MLVRWQKNLSQKEKKRGKKATLNNKIPLLSKQHLKNGFYLYLALNFKYLKIVLNIIDIITSIFSTLLKLRTGGIYFNNKTLLKYELG
jgi:hypothetical protein